MMLKSSYGCWPWSPPPKTYSTLPTVSAPQSSVLGDGAVPGWTFDRRNNNVETSAGLSTFTVTIRFYLIIAARIRPAADASANPNPSGP